MKMLVLALACALVCFAPSALAAPDAVVVPPNDFDTSQLAALLAAHKWVPASALVVGFLVWLQKKGKLPGFNSIPPNYRPFLALGLGILSGVLNKIAVDSKTWLVAILDGVLSAIIAISAHDTLIEGLRNGKEIGGGGRPNPSSVFILVGALSVVSAIQACGYGKPACEVIDIAQANCTWLRYLESDGTVKQVQLTPEEAREFGHTMAAKRATEARLDGGAK